ncbi:MAG: sugar phosphate nucleotidyltransferase, partial [Nevskiales bacterium]
MRLPAYAVILAGGYGTRFWPASRRARPKQFLPLLGRESLLQQTYRRLARLFPPGRIYVVGNAEHRSLLARQLPRIPPGRLLLEPAGRNTAAAVALAAAHIRAALPAGADAVLGVFPADHGIQREARLLRLARAALAAAAREQAIVVLGVPPSSPQSGYGYLERGRSLRRQSGERVLAVRRFTEKPNSRTAARYLRSGRYFWNSGMFFWRLSTFDHLLARYLPWTRRAVDQLAPTIGTRGYNTCLRRLYRSLE